MRVVCCSTVVVVVIKFDYHQLFSFTLREYLIKCLSSLYGRQFTVEMTSELSKQRTKGLPSRMGSTGGEGCWMICPPDPLMTLGQRFHKNNSVGNRRECDVIDGVGITPPSPRPAGLAAAGDLKAGAPRALSTIYLNFLRPKCSPRHRFQRYITYDDMIWGTPSLGGCLNARGVAKI